MISNKTNSYYYCAVKNLPKLKSLGWLRGKKETIINNENSFQNTLDDALNCQTIKTNPEKISKLKPCINKNNWEGIDVPAGPREWQKFERSKKTIALNILFIQRNRQAISVAYRSEYSSKRKRQVILLMITDDKKWHYLAAINLLVLFKEKLSNYKRDLYCLNCFNL